MSDTDWQAAVGREEVREQVLEIESLRRFALAIDADPDVERNAPPLAHWAFFLPEVRDAEIGADGHPRLGGFLPAVPLPRRMFAASDMRFEAPLALGRPATLTSTLAALTPKRGSSGDLVFVEVERVLRQDGAARVAERQTYVYREEEVAAAMPVPVDDLPGERWEPEATHLFRFSAATFNAHRIHYDLPYATGVEGYPALVVHGPFTAARLAALAARGGTLARFAFRAQAPLFLGQPIHLRRVGDEVTATRCDGATAMTATFAYS